MKRIPFTIMSLIIICCIGGHYASVVSAQDAYLKKIEQDLKIYISLLQENKTEEVERVFWYDIEACKWKSSLPRHGEKLDMAKSISLMGKQTETDILLMILRTSILSTKQYDFGFTQYEKLLAYFAEVGKSGDSKYVDPFSSTIKAYRGELWEAKGQYEKAIEDYSAADSGGYGYLAWLLATCPDDQYRDGKKAVEYAKKHKAGAEKASHGHYSILAAAYAEDGNFQEAIKVQEEALSLLLGPAGNKGMTEEDRQAKKVTYENYLALYKEGKPLRMEPPKTE